MKWKVAKIALHLLVIGGVMLGVSQLIVRAAVGTTNPACVGSLTTTTYPGGITAGTFSSTTAISVLPGTGLQLNTNLTPLDPTRIVLPFDQDVKVKWVYRNSGASHSVGWFYLDQLQSFLDKPATDPTAKLVDNDADGVADFFQTQNAPLRPKNGLFQITPGQTVPDLFNGSFNYSDGGLYPHISNLVESVMSTGGGMIFKIDDDDGDNSVQGPWSSLPDAPANDYGGGDDGIPDYDVNGDGTIDFNDRTVDLGIIQGNREIVFFANFYYGFNMRQDGIGIASATSSPGPTLTTLNPAPSGGSASGDVLKFSDTSLSGGGNLYMYYAFSNTAQTIAAGDCVEYDVYLTSATASIGGIDIRNSDGSYWRDQPGWADQNSVTGHPSGDISPYATLTWYHRKLPVPPSMVGKTTSQWDIVDENDTSSATHTVYFDNMRVTTCATSATKATAYASGGPSASGVDMQNGFSAGAAALPYYYGQTVPWFTKPLLNADFKAYAPNTVIQRSALGCARDDSSCYTSKHDSGGVAATLGWMDQNAINRLNTAPYNFLHLDDTVVDVKSDANGNTPHFIVAAPVTDPNRWLLAFDDQPGYPGASDFDYNDSVFLLEHVNGGSVVSNLISNIAAVDLPNTVISKVRVHATAAFPAPGCSAIGDGSVDFYYSVDDGATWHLAGSADRNNLSLDITIDVLGAGFVGNKLRWKANINSTLAACQPTIVSVDEGYEAIAHGQFKYAAPIPLSNVVYSGSLETPPFPASEPTPTRNDYSLRGHFFSERLYDPLAPTVTALKQEWDGGVKLATRNPDARVIYSSVSGTTRAFDNTNRAYYESLILPGTLMSIVSPKVNGQYVYDFNGDGAVNTADADFVLQWTRGWEYPGTVTFTPAVLSLQRAWKLGPVHNSSPAIVGPSPSPTWNGGSAVPAAMTTGHNTYITANAARATVAIVGGQDGMVHGFDAGQFRYGNNVACPANLSRGCYAGPDEATEYGSGAEQWAWVPPSQLSQLKNNHPSTRTYLSSANPQAEVDGSVAVDDIWVAGTSTFKTVAFASLGRAQPYITAIDVSGSTPVGLWTADFSDVNFNGSELSPSIGLTTIPTSGIPGTFTMVSTSGLSTSAVDEYLYFINPLTGVIIDPANGTNDITLGHTKGKIQLNAGNTLPAYNTPSLGFAGYPNLVDANQDGLIDRVYAVDTIGRIFKYDIPTRTKCVVAATGETVFSGMAIDISGSAVAPLVKLYLGGGPNPDGSGSTTGGGTAGAYRTFAFQDSDVVGTCTPASVIYTHNLAAGEKLWAAPFVGGTDVFYATSSSLNVGICAAGNGNLLDFSTGGDGTNPTVILSPQTIPGTSVSSLRVYDGHAIMNTVGGQTTIIGGTTWNNAASAGSGSTGTSGTIGAMRTLLWMEL